MKLQKQLVKVKLSQVGKKNPADAGSMFNVKSADFENIRDRW